MDKKQFEDQLKELADVKFDSEANGFVIKKLKKTQHQCERCDKTSDKPITVRSSMCHAPFVYWRHQCKGCTRYLHPITYQPLEGPLSTTAARIISIIRKARKLGTVEEQEVEIPTPVAELPEHDQGTLVEEIQDGPIIIRRWDHASDK